MNASFDSRRGGEAVRQHMDAECDLWVVYFAAWAQEHIDNLVMVIRAAYGDGYRDALEPRTILQIENERAQAVRRFKESHAQHRPRSDAVSPARRASDPEDAAARAAEAQRERDSRRARRAHVDQPAAPEVKP